LVSGLPCEAVRDLISLGEQLLDGATHVREGGPQLEEGLFETSLPLLVLFRYIIWTTPKKAEDGFEISAARDGSIGIAPRPLWGL
jgi:hypothetical protein